LVRDRGTVLTSMISPTFSVRRISTNSGMVRVDWPMVKTGPI
jgi:hypothetical protein